MVTILGKSEKYAFNSLYNSWFSSIIRLFPQFGNNSVAVITSPLSIMTFVSIGTAFIFLGTTSVHIIFNTFAISDILTILSSVILSLLLTISVRWHTSFNGLFKAPILAIHRTKSAFLGITGSWLAGNFIYIPFAPSASTKTTSYSLHIL